MLLFGAISLWSGSASWGLAVSIKGMCTTGVVLVGKCDCRTFDD